MRRYHALCTELGMRMAEHNAYTTTHNPHPCHGESTATGKTSPSSCKARITHTQIGA